MTATPALDFLRRVQVWQESDANKTAGLIVVMPGHEQSELGEILAEADTAGNQNWSENRARRWLVGYREMENEQHVLTTGQRAELEAVVRQVAAEDRLTGTRTAHWTPRRKPLSRNRLTVLIILVTVITGVAVAIGIAAIIQAATGTGNGSPPAAGAPANPAPPQPGQLTDLQHFRADWNVPLVASPDAGNPARLVLLQDGLYYPTPWVVPAGDAGWVTDTTGSIAGQPVINGGQAGVTDSNGTTWTVAVGQPFAVASNPQVILRVLHDGTVQSMPGAHASAIRVHA